MLLALILRETGKGGEGQVHYQQSTPPKTRAQLALRHDRALRVCHGDLHCNHLEFN